MVRLLLVAAGGAVGTGTRYILSLWIPRLLGPGFPFATLLVNVGGSFLIGLLMQWSLSTTAISPTLRLVLTTGFLGGLTTFSTFSYETIKLIEDRAFLDAAVNVLLSFSLGLGGCFLGMVAAKALLVR